MTLTVSMCLIAVIASVAPVSAQSLAEVARREATRRGSINGTVRVFTNASLGDAPVASTPPSLPTTEIAAPEAKTTERSPATPETPVAGAADFDDRGKEYWRARADGLRQRLARAKNDVVALTARAAGLDDGSAADRSERGVTLAALRTAAGDLRALDVEWVAFEKEAQVARVPRHWLG